jgi:hypothetical protein
VGVITRVDLDLGQPQHQDATYLERCWRVTSDTVVR